MAREVVIDAQRLEPDADSYESLLEEGTVLRVCGTTLLPESDLTFLRRLNQVAATHKNVAYDAHRDRLTGVSTADRAATAQLRRAMLRYAARVTELVSAVCVGYAQTWRVDLTSFRPVEEAERSLRGRERNDRLHIDAFPSRPTHGDRILRVFTNVHPGRARTWLTGEPLHQLLPQMATLAGFPRPPSDRLIAASLRKRLAGWIGVPAVGRSPYDAFMLRLHDFMKNSAELQRSCHRDRHVFSPGDTWLVFTDTIPHAVLEGQFALEQTFIVPTRALIRPALAPVSLIEGLTQPGAGAH